ncbi:MAG: hypothetical protein JXB17_13645 [Bacteroidales bacterium]|nr:hypothetical protein [Bacteroidales bacterium]
MLENIMSNTEITKIYVRLIDGTQSYVPIDAETTDSVSFKILPISNYNSNDRTVLFEFKPFDIVHVKIQDFSSSKSSGLVACEFADVNTSSFDFNQFLLHVLDGTINDGIENKHKYYDYIQKLNQEIEKGIWHYPGIKKWINTIKK